MTDRPAGPPHRPRFKKTRSAALGFGLGATLALSPLVWAQNPPASSEAPPPVAGMLPQQSFAPLVKRVLPAVVNISVTEKRGADAASDQLPESFRGTPFEDLLRRFFDEHGGGQLDPHRFSQGPGEEGGVQRIARSEEHTSELQSHVNLVCR